MKFFDFMTTPHDKYHRRIFLSILNIFYTFLFKLFISGYYGNFTIDIAFAFASSY